MDNAKQIKDLPDIKYDKLFRDQLEAEPNASAEWYSAMLAKSAGPEVEPRMTGEPGRMHSLRHRPLLSHFHTSSVGEHGEHERCRIGRAPEAQRR